MPRAQFVKVTHPDVEGVYTVPLSALAHYEAKGFARYDEADHVPPAEPTFEFDARTGQMAEMDGQDELPQDDFPSDPPGAEWTAEGESDQGDDVSAAAE